MALEIFAGPIVRRATVNEVYIWIATIGSPVVSVRLFCESKIIGEGTAQTIKLNEKLNIHLIKITPLIRSLFPPATPVSYILAQHFPVNKPISYSIGIPTIEGRSYDYEEFNMTIIKEKLAYGNEQWADPEAAIRKQLNGDKPNLPTFIIPGDNTKLNIAFGSCRKPHDKGEDAFMKIDTLINRTRSTINKRPHVLYLGGDQIYADDVHDTVFAAIKEVCNKYSLIDSSQKIYNIVVENRISIVRKMGFKSGESKNHLLFLGEYVAMYGLVWNRMLWENYKNDKELSDFFKGLLSVRRVMANTATYMIFDDHDVTDDWFITGDNKKQVLNNGPGRRSVANAMAAYFVFQGWGNAPDNFAFEEVKKIIEGRNISPASFDSYFLKQNWEFETPTNPVSYFLDTRTRRGGNGFPPLLKENWDTTKVEVKNKNLPFVLVAPGPIVTYPLIDYIQEKAAAVPDLYIPDGIPAGKYGADYESWIANKQNYFLLFNYFKAKGISKAVVMSGDVHYGYSAIFSLYNKEQMLKKSGAFALNCLQITSSALKNSAAGLKYLSIPSYFVGTLYFLMFADGIQLAVERDQYNIVQKSVNKVMLNYTIENGKILKKENLIAAFLPLNENLYPELILELNIDSRAPETAGFIKEHNFVHVSIMQNKIIYSFYNGNNYQYSL